MQDLLKILMLDKFITKPNLLIWLIIKSIQLLQDIDILKCFTWFHDLLCFFIGGVQINPKTHFMYKTHNILYPELYAQNNNLKHSCTDEAQRAVPTLQTWYWGAA